MSEENQNTGEQNTPPEGGTPPISGPDSNNSDWRAALPEDLQTAPALKDIKSIDALASHSLRAPRQRWM